MSASMVNVGFGTRRGWGEALTEQTPFVSTYYCTNSFHCRCFGISGTLLTLLQVSDTLCTQCLTGLAMVEYNKTEVLKLGVSQLSNGCRLCALLLARFRTTATETSIEIEYRIIPRYGYFIRVFDIVFRPAGAKNWRTNVLRLGIQKEKLDRGQSQLSLNPFRRIGVLIYGHSSQTRTSITHPWFTLSQT